MFLILPQYDGAVSQLITILEVAELPIILWLAIVGARDPAGESDGHAG